jgi:hypothetical protein
MPRSSSLHSTLPLAALAALAAAAAAPALAETTWSLDTGAAWSDNVTLVATDEISDTMLTAGGSLGYSYSGPRLTASVNGYGNYQYYVDDTYDPSWQAYVAAILTYAFVPERFLWNVANTYGQITVDQFENATPDNRQGTNYFTTGPEVRLPIGTQSELIFIAEYANAWFEDTDQVNQDSYFGSLEFRRNVSPSTYWGLVATGTRVEYDAPGDPSYDQWDLYATWSATSARQTITIGAGTNNVSGDGESFSRPLFSLDWQRTLSPSWTMNANAFSGYQNTASQFFGSDPTLDPGTQNISVSQAPADTTTASLMFNFERPRTTAFIGGGYQQLDYVVDTGLDQESWYAGVGASRRFRPRLQGFIDYRYSRYDYEQASTESQWTQTASVRLAWQAARSLFVTLGYRYTDQSGETAADGYTENLFFLTLSFRRGDSQGSPTFVN